MNAILYSFSSQLWSITKYCVLRSERTPHVLCGFFQEAAIAAQGAAAAAQADAAAAQADAGTAQGAADAAQGTATTAQGAADAARGGGRRGRSGGAAAAAPAEERAATGGGSGSGGGGGLALLLGSVLGTSEIALGDTVVLPEPGAETSDSASAGFSADELRRHELDIL